MSVVSEIKKGSKKIKAAQLDRITDISGRYFAEYNSSTGECKNPVAEPITDIIITGNSTKVNADPDIPNDYVAIEYIETTSTQYIDTLVSIDSITNVKYEMDINLTQLNGRDGFIGADYCWYNGLACHNLEDGFIFANENRPLVRLNYGPLSTGVRYKIIVDKDSLTVNGVSGKENSDTNASFKEKNIFIPNIISSGRRGLLKYYMCKISIDGNLTRYFVPVIRKSDNKPGMYDKVSKQFFVNQGTGEFITGPELPGKILETDTLTKCGKNLIIMNSEWKTKSEYLEAHNGYFEVNYDNVTDSTVYILGYIDNSHLKLIPGHTYTLKHTVYKYADNTNNINYIEFGSYLGVISAIPSEVRATDEYRPRTFIAQEYNISEKTNDSIRVVVYVAPHTKRHERYYTMITETSSEQIYEPYQQPEVIDLQPIHGIGELKDKIEVVRDVEYNQLVINGNLVEDKNWSDSNSTHKINNFVMESTATAQYGGVAQYFDARKYREHKMLCILEGMIEPNDTESYFGICLNDNYSQSLLPMPTKANEWQLLYAFGTINKNADYPSNPLVKIQDQRTSNWTKRYARNIRVIDLTKLFGAGNEPTTLEDFYLTPIGKLIQKGIYLPYSESNNRISKVIRYHAINKLDLGTFDYNIDTVDGNPGFVAKSIPPNIQRDDTSINDAGYKYDGSLSKDCTFNTYRGSGGLWFRNDAFTRDQQGCDDLKASLSGKYLLYKLLTPYYEDITDTPQGQVLLNLTPYQPYTTEFEVNNDGTIEFGYWRQIDPLPDTYTRVKALVSDGNQKITVSDIVGKNIWDEEWEKGNWYVADGTPNDSAPAVRCKNFIKVKPNTTYYHTIQLAYWFIMFDINKQYIGYAGGSNSWTTNPDCYYIKFYCEYSYGTTYNHDICIMEYTKGMDTSYVPYISTMQNNSLEMSEPKKTLFQNKDNRVLSVDGYALKYNQLRMNSYSYTNAGVTITANGGYETIVTGTSQSAVIWSKKITNDYYSKNGHLYGFIFPEQDLSVFRQVGCYLFANKGAGAKIVEKYVSSNSLNVLKATQDDCSLEIGIAINQDTTINSKIIYQTVDLTDMFGAGNEPTTLDEFYATPQGKLYRGYVEYGYHILGAGEYKSNQLVDDELKQSITYDGITGTYDEGSHSYTFSGVSTSGSNFYFTRKLQLTKDHTYLIPLVNLTGGGNVLIYSYHVTKVYATARKPMIFKSSDTTTALLYLNYGYAGINVEGTFCPLIIDVTELGLDHLTLDELKAQRPDLFVYKPYHETETRYGMILSDGRVQPLTGPLYGLNDVKDKGETVGKETRKYGSYTFTGDESYESLTYKRVYVTPSSSFTPKLTGNRSNIANCIFPNLKTVGEDVIEGSAMQIGINQLNGTIGIVLEKYTDSSDMGDIQAVKDAIIGKTLIYELATPTITQSTSTSIDMDTTIVNEQYTAYFTSVEQWIAKYYSGTHAVLNYIPAVRNSDLKPGMYEVATGEFKTNEGTGEFTYINDWTVNEPVTLEVDENKVEE